MKEAQGIQISDILQLCCINGLTGTAEIREPSKTGWVYLTEGQIVHAVFGSLSGEKAFYRLVNSSSGDFEFQEGPHRNEPSIQKGWEYLLMEAARISDVGEQQESRADRKAQTRLTLTLKRVQIQLAPDRAPHSPRIIETSLTGSIEIGDQLEECMIDRIGMDECWLRCLTVFELGDEFFMRFKLSQDRPQIRVKAEVLSARADDISMRVRFLSLDTESRSALGFFVWNA
ncbi:MAG: DUF4388 domain-containing protein [Deltaproteobacteria bacterium]|nr:DUF4388 domain-containing protein [Deltaproteobacteria bacterium]